MKILFLTNNPNTEHLIDWLKIAAKEEVIVWGEGINYEDLKTISPDYIISYNYKYIIKKEVLDFLPDRVINLHISFLPYNRGSNPNIWSFLEDTPKGVTIHLVDEGLDTGDILVQKEIYFDEGLESLKSSYDKLHNEIQNLFKEYWSRIKAGDIEPIKQSGDGSTNTKKDFLQIEPLLKEKGWDSPIREIKKHYLQRTVK
jgi:methionyl-tRNA formyltransferase